MIAMNPSLCRVRRTAFLSLVGLALATLVGCATPAANSGWRAGLDAYEDGRFEDAELSWLEALAHGAGEARGRALRGGVLGEVVEHVGREPEPAAGRAVHAISLDQPLRESATGPRVERRIARQEGLDEQRQLRDFDERSR